MPYWLSLEAASELDTLHVLCPLIITSEADAFYWLAQLSVPQL